VINKNRLLGFYCHFPCKTINGRHCECSLTWVYSENGSKILNILNSCLCDNAIRREKPGDEDFVRLDQMKIPFLLNFAQCQLLLNDFYPAIEHTTEVLKRDPGSTYCILLHLWNLFVSLLIDIFHSVLSIVWRQGDIGLKHLLWQSPKAAVWFSQTRVVFGLVFTLLWSTVEIFSRSFLYISVDNYTCYLLMYI